MTSQLRKRKLMTTNTKNKNAIKINQALDVKLFDETDIYRLKLNKFTKKQIKDLVIDDLIDKNGKGTERLARFVKEILF